MLGILLLVGILLALIVFFIANNYRRTRQNDIDIQPEVLRTGIQRGVLQSDSTFTPGHSVVGAILPDRTVSEELLVTGELISLGPSAIAPPVGTILVNSAPPDVQRELLVGTPISPLEGINVPDTFDCRDQWPGLISNPYHQGSCGSCWAFAAAMALSDRLRIINPDDEELTT